MTRRFREVRSALRQYAHYQRLRVTDSVADGDEPYGDGLTLMDYFENATQVVLEAAQHDERAWRWMGMVDRRLVREESQG